MQQVGLAADLAIFNIGLPAARRVIHNRFVPFAAAGALESRLHSLIILRLGFLRRLQSIKALSHAAWWLSVHVVRSNRLFLPQGSISERCVRLMMSRPGASSSPSTSRARSSTGRATDS